MLAVGSSLTVLHGHGRVAGQLSALPVRQVAAGTTFTVALTATGRVFQMGETGAQGGQAPWEGTLTPELVSDPWVDACDSPRRIGPMLVRPAA